MLFLSNIFLFQLGYAQYFQSATDTNLYDVVARMNTILPAFDTIEDGARMQFDRWKNFWETRLYLSGSFSLANQATYNYVQNFSNANRISSVVQANWIPLGPSAPVDPLLM